MNNPTAQLTQRGVSIWLDDLSRERIVTGNLEGLIESHSVRGVTTNPTIFAGALSKGAVYAAAIAEQVAAGASTTETVFAITSSDVAAACDIFKGVYEESAGVDGRVSIEVEPGLAHNSAATVVQAKQLYARVDRENVMIKIPATKAGLEAITAVTGEGISVNVTLIFSVERYNEVIDAYIAGLRLAQNAGHDLKKIHSVASFFVSRVDTEIDKRLEQIGTPEAIALKSKAAIANARLAYELFEKRLQGEDWRALAAAGAQLQRPLMASTGVKDPSLPDTLYVTELVSENLVNTMPEKTLQAVAYHGVIPENSIRGKYEQDRQVLSNLSSMGIDIKEVTELLEAEGVEKFIISWNELLETVRTAMDAA